LKITAPPGSAIAASCRSPAAGSPVRLAALQRSIFVASAIREADSVLYKAYRVT
jgi:hypothetical protein